MNLTKCAEEFAKIIDKIPSKVGVFHSSTIRQTTQIAECLLMNEVSGARSWWTALSKLSEGETTFIIVDEYMPDELTDVINQLVAKQDEIEVFDRRLSEQVRIKVSRSEAKLLLIGDRSLLKNPAISTIDAGLVLGH